MGGNKTIDVDIRVVAATHRDLEAMVRENRFREDLFFRLQVFPITIPPLRHRKKDIPLLARHFLVKKAGELGFSKIAELAPGSLELLSRYDWPGNVRELENMIVRVLILNPDGPISFDSILEPLENAGPGTARVSDSDSLLLNDVIAEHIRYILGMTGGKINGRDGAAELMGINPSTLRHKMRKMKIPLGRGVH